jgi:2-polyprenyl-3-methyl-5-hydroxy-6-metoxy-1,4-benzoquinol methylase
MGAVVENYGWTGTAPTCSAAYLIEPVVSELRRVGAKRVIDLGCGNGAMSHLIQSRGFEVVGCDVDAAGIELASRTASGARFLRIGLYDSPEALGPLGYDAAVSTEVVEHLFEPRTLPAFAARVLKPRGSLLVSTPYHGWLKNVLIALAGKWDSHHSPLHDGGHIKFWSYRTLSQLLAENGFAVQRFIGAGRIPLLWKSMIVSARLASAEPSVGVTRTL